MTGAGRMEPEVGIEPTTCSLRESRSATELLGPLTTGHGIRARAVWAPIRGGRPEWRGLA